MNASLRPRGGEGALFLIDANNFLFRAYHALPPLNASDGTPVQAVHGFVRMVQALRREFAPQHMVAIFDGGGPGFRNELYAGYKANRPPPPEDLVPQFPLVRAAIDALGIVRLEQPGMEADDLIASYARDAQRHGHSVVIVSSDKDLMQLVDEGGPDRRPIVLWDTMKSSVIGPAQVQEKFGVEPERLGDLLALMGDSSDNVPGVPGIGAKTAAALLHEFGDLEGVLQRASEIPQAKRRERLLEHREQARLSRKLVELRCDLELPISLEGLVDRGLDVERARAFFEPLGFKAVLRELGAQAAVQVSTQTDDAAPVEVRMAAGYRLPRDAFSLVLASDVEGVRALATALANAERVAVHVIADGTDPLRSHGVGIGFVGIGKGAPMPAPTYLSFGHEGLGRASSDMVAAALALVRPVLEDVTRPKTVHDFKTQALVLEGCGIALRGCDVDPMLLSYTLDAARPSHDLEALASELLHHECVAKADLTGKGRKEVTLGASDPQHVTAFACERVHVAFALGEHLREELERAGSAPLKLYRDIELPLAEVLRRVERRGIVLDPDVLREQSRALGRTIASIRESIAADVGHPVNLDSPIQLRKLLFEERGLPTGKKTKTGFSTDAKVLEELAMLDPIVGRILEYRSLTKLKGTYLDTLPLLIHPSTGRLHTSFHQAVAATGRLSSSDPNLQNIPIRTEHGKRIREAFIAPEGRKLVSLDYSQIELRILAHLSRDPNLCSAFEEGVDVHRRTAAEVFGCAESAVTDEQRRIAKAVNFGVVYGQTAFGLAQQLGIPRGKAGTYIKAYFESIPGVEAYMRELVEVARRRGYAETILGRTRRIPELAMKGARRGQGERMARNTPIQGSAADILKLAMIEVEHALEGRDFASMLLTVHDELIFECDEARVDELIALARPLMEHAFDLSVPVVVEAGSGRTWAECKG